MNTRTEISSIGEFGLINRLKEKFSLENSSSIKGIGDDAGVIDIGDHYLLVSTDILIEGIHFDLSFMPLKHLGYKAVAVNVSDIAAMNGLAEQITVTIGISNRFSVEAIEEIYEGIKMACANYKVDLIGGDTSSTTGGLILSITAVGRVSKNKIAYRHTASENDIICVTGDLGGAYVGLQLLHREKEVFLSNPEMQPELEGKSYIIGRQLKPEARTDIIHELADLHIIPTSMIDVSDGVASELFHLCKNSNLGAVIYEDHLPIDGVTFETAVEFNLDPITCALNGGEDYELLFTISQNDFEKIKNHADIFYIGFMTKKENGIRMKLKSGSEIPLKAQGWKHF